MTHSETSQIDTPEVQLSCEDIFASLHRRGQLLPLFRGIAMEAIIEHAARNAGLTVSDRELQKASEQLRRQLGLQSAEKTRDWLHEERLSVEQFERRVEQDVLVEKLKDHLLTRYGEQHFQTNADAWSPVKLRRITVSSLNEARELCLQIQEEGGDFAELAGKFSLDSHVRQTRGDLGILLKANLRMEIRDAIFSTKQGAVTSPAHGPDGYEIYLVEEFPAPAFNAVTQTAIREELFRTFISLKLRDVKITGPHFPAPINNSAFTNAESESSVPTSDL
jgi:parvulin-like peptidyl-prolyl isomerase